jgi:nucleoside-diphosphate-sugar epimerase
MKIAVIGGSGFVGSRLIEELLVTNDVVNFDKVVSPLFPHITRIVDIRDKDGLASALAGFDLVILLAAEHRDDVSPINLYYDVNVEGTRNVLASMRENGIGRIIFTSTVAIYGLNQQMPDENFVATPFNHYGKSKWMAEQCISEWQEESDSHASIIVRPTVIFGERNRGNVYNLLNHIAKGHFVKIGSGENRKSLAYIGNVTAFFRYHIAKGFYGKHVYNYVDGPDLSVNELLQIASNTLKRPISKVRIPYQLGMTIGYILDFFAMVASRKFPVSAVRIRKFCATTQFNATKAFSTGFSQPFSLPDALQQTIRHEFIESNIDKVKFFTE